MKLPAFDRYHLVLMGVILSAIPYILLLGNNSLLSRCTVQKKIDNTMLDINRLKEENRLLSEEVHRLKSDDRYIETIAHKLGYIRPSEKLYKFVAFKTNDGTVLVTQKSPFLLFLKQNLRFIISGFGVLAVLAIYLFIRIRRGGRRSTKIDNTPKNSYF